MPVVRWEGKGKDPREILGGAWYVTAYCTDAVFCRDKQEHEHTSRNRTGREGRVRVVRVG